MILVADNDALLKLCAYGLWDDACVLIGVREVRTLQTARFFLRGYAKRAPKQAKYTAAGLSRAVLVAEGASVVEPPADMSEHDALLAAARLLPPDGDTYLDAGETLLFVAAGQYLPDVLLTTGDKRALRALASLPEGQSVCDRLAGRVVCVEQVVQQLLPVLGLETVQTRILAAPACDGALTNVFGRSAPASAASVEEGLQSYLSDLRAATGLLMA